MKIARLFTANTLSHWCLYSALCSALLLSGCATKVEVTGNFPTPIIHQLPLSLAVHYPEPFSKYRYEEKSESRSGRSIGIGSAQVKLFSTILPALFQNVIPVKTLTDGKTDQPVDLVLTLAVDDFQYTLPKETKVQMYEVWIKYNLQLFDPQGQLIADWILTAYGKTPSAMLKTEGDLLNDAMVVALRDAGAGLSLSFTKVPEIKQWLEQRKRSSI